MSAPAPAGSPLPGDPEQARRVSAQLAAVELRTREIESRLRAIETGVGPQVWRGRAADGFAALLAATGPDLTALATSYGAASQALATYATELAAAQDVARAAEAEAAAATGDRDRAAADRDTAEADAVRYATAADEARLRLDPVAAQDTDQRRTDALGRAAAAGAAVGRAEQAQRAAQQKADEAADRRATAAARCIRELDEASSGGIDSRNLARPVAMSVGPPPTTGGDAIERGIRDAATATGKNAVDDLQQKWPLHAADLAVNGVVGALAAKQLGILGKESDRLMRESAQAADRYLTAIGSVEQRTLDNNHALGKFLEADEAKRRAESVGRSVGSKIPLAGLAITGAGIGYDISQGKPPVKAVVSGVAGSLVAGVTGGKIGAFAGARIGAMLGVGAGPAGIVVGAVGGLVVGTLASGAIDVGYDMLPKGLQEAVESGTKAVGDAVGGIGKAVESGVKDVWDRIF
jgi:hypothetical protein